MIHDLFYLMGFRSKNADAFLFSSRSLKNILLYSFFDIALYNFFFLRSRRIATPANTALAPNKPPATPNLRALESLLLYRSIRLNVSLVASEEFRRVSLSQALVVLRG